MTEALFIETPAGEVFVEKRGASGGVPLIGVHGGPGFTSHYLEPLFSLSEHIPVILYDQAGCGRARRGGPRKLFTVDGFVAELEAIRRTLGLERMHLFGHSFGGVIIGEYALRYPERVASLIFCSASIDIPRWVEDGERLVGALPLMQRMILREGARTGATASPEYLSALRVYYTKHIYGCETLSEGLRRAEAEEDSQTYQTVWGPNELVVTGVIRDYNLSPRLPEIKAPTMFMCGRFDEATPEAHKYFASKVSGSRAHVFEKSAHFPHVTEEDECLSVLRAFIREL
jgi:proline-specific peptidase